LPPNLSICRHLPAPFINGGRTDGRADGHLRPTLLGRLRGVELKTKARFGRILRPPAYKWSGPILKERNK